MNIVATTVALNVGDVAASSMFFTTHLGFREALSREDFVALSRDDGAADILLQQRSPEEPPSPGLADVIVSFAVTDIAAEYERLREEGANITAPLQHEPWGEWVLRLTDPNGVVVQLVEWIPPSRG
ncbi:VOC family protein [Nonomuraea sp. NPDC049152]|uniref:VOC family protein n=1 Tax=Nonomuraea sp. NPDC049152 TaxID=3154350 RepID=UPI0033E7EBB9